MENLTQAQKNIVKSLVSEFTNLNEKYTSNETNIFAHLVDEVKSENKRIDEIKILNKIGREKINNQTIEDFNKYWDAFDEIGIKIIMSYPHVNEDYFELVTFNQNKKITDRHGRNILKWKYSEVKDCEYILGSRIEWICDFRIEWNGKRFLKIEELFEDNFFQNYLKELISEA